MSRKFYCVLLASFLISATPGNATRTKDRMYEQINGVAACFRKLNGTHQTGCASDMNGATGVIHLVETESDLQIILDKGTGGPYIPLMLTTLLSYEIAEILKSSDKITGLAVYKGSVDRYSLENKCPSRNYGLENTCEVDWNEEGRGLLDYDFNFPMFYVTNSSDVAKMKDCFYRFNNHSLETQHERSLCSLELRSFMVAAIDTPTCLRRSKGGFNINAMKFCDPMGDENIWASLFPVGNSSIKFGAVTLNQTVRNDMKYIIVAARLDTTSLFLDQVPGAINPVTGIVTLLSTAKLLKEMLPTYDNYDKNVLFLLLNGETYDYIGSQRVVYDMDKLEFPVKEFRTPNESMSAISLDDISLIVELNQLSKTDSIYVHTYDNTPEIASFVTRLKNNGGEFVKESKPGILPPSSLQTFLRSRPNISGLVIADHNQGYANKFYNSIYDNAENIGYRYYNGLDISNNTIQSYVASISKTLAMSLFEEITGDRARDIEVDVQLVDELFNCYLLNGNCKIHQVIQRKKFAEQPMSFYVGVSGNINFITKLIGLTLGWLTADKVSATAPCPPHLQSYINTFFNMSASISDLNTTICYRTCMNFTEALSPAFVITNYDWKSHQYSSWSESIWKDFNVQMFLKPSAAHEIVSMAVGSIVLVLSFVLVYFINSRSHILFPNPSTITPTRC